MIDLNDLRHSIDRALKFGRYQIVVKPVGIAGAYQVPASITLDLLERDDDLFDTDEPSRRQYGATVDPLGDALVDTVTEPKNTVETLTLRIVADTSEIERYLKDAERRVANLVTDDHGPAIPAQGENHYTDDGEKTVRVYEFALQDAVTVHNPKPERLEDVFQGHAPDLVAAAEADWVHVYDRVTHERRTLKRPEPDAVLTGLRDVAADLRRGYKPDEASHVQSSADPMPPVGPLTSTEGLKAGDVLRSLWTPADARYREGGLVRCLKTEDGVVFFNDEDGDERYARPVRLAFVCRPGVWMPWEGGENPVPGMTVRLQLRGCKPDDDRVWQSDCQTWANNGLAYDIISYMVVDPSPVSSDT